MTKNSARLLLGGLLAVGLLSGPRAAHAAGEGQIGFIVDNEFSTFLSANGELLIDLFAPLRDLPNFDGFFNTESQTLEKIGLFNNVEGLTPGQIMQGAVRSFSLIGDGTAGFRMVVNPDPFILYEVEIENPTDAPMDVDLSISPPIIPVPGTNNVTSELNVELFDANGDGMAFINDLDQEFSVFDSDFILQNAGVDIRDSIDQTGLTSFFNAETTGPTAPSALGWEFMDVFTTFTLSPGDRVVLTGMVGIGNPGTFFPRLSQVNFAALPEPSTAALLLVISATGILRRRY